MAPMTMPAIPPPDIFLAGAGAVVAAMAVADVEEGVDEAVLGAVELELPDAGVALALALVDWDGCVSLVDVVEAVVANKERLLSPSLTSQIRYVIGSASWKSVARYSVVQTDHVAPLHPILSAN
jgi:hypothetical protein